MFCFSLPTKIKSYDTLAEFVQAEGIASNHLVLTSKVLEPFLKPLNLDCRILFQEDYGVGEPNDRMIDSIRTHIPTSISRIIAIGGGTVIDIAKVLTYGGEWTTEELFTGKVNPEKTRSLTVIPTTCGTGSEVTNVTICELKNLHTKKGLAQNSMYADDAVLIPELIYTLPYRFFATSAIDALIHAVESYLSPKAIAHSKLYSEKAIEMILSGFSYVAENGQDKWNDKATDFLIASNFAGIAFGYAGCAAVHALSYPLGGKYHIPHGEANQLMFAAVLQAYKSKQPHGRLEELESLLNRVLGTNQGLEALYALMEKILPRKPLREYGISHEELTQFTDSVIEGQQRLLKNNYVPMSREELLAIYEVCY